MLTSDKAKRIYFLDWLRIFAFSGVLLGHKFYDQLLTVSNDSSVHESLRYLIQLSLPFFLAGGAGVVVFFLISGYVIMHVLQTDKPLDFCIKRIFRIYPLYIFAVLLQYFLLMVIDNATISLQILIPQLLLIGDFFNTPHTLNGVEWTLRIEVLFYLFMFAMKYFNLIGSRQSLLPWLLIPVVLALGWMPAFPGSMVMTGYVNFYAPFLFLGTIIWLFEHKYITGIFTGMFTAMVFIQHWHLIDTISPYWQHCHFAVLAFLLFITTFAFRDKITSNKSIFFVSELTYAVYLLHNWLFTRLQQLPIGKNLPHRNVWVLLCLLAISALLVKVVEKPGVRMGKQCILYLRNQKQSRKTSVPIQQGAVIQP